MKMSLKKANKIIWLFHTRITFWLFLGHQCMGPIWVLHGAKVQVDFKSKLTLECSERGPMKDPAPALALKFGVFWPRYKSKMWMQCNCNFSGGRARCFFYFRLNFGVLNLVWLSCFYRHTIPWFILFHLDTKNLTFGAFLTKLQVKAVNEMQLQLCRRQSPLCFFSFRLNLGILNLIWLSWF